MLETEVYSVDIIFDPLALSLYLSGFTLYCSFFFFFFFFQPYDDWCTQADARLFPGSMDADSCYRLSNLVTRTTPRPPPAPVRDSCVYTTSRYHYPSLCSTSLISVAHLSIRSFSIDALFFLSLSLFLSLVPTNQPTNHPFFHSVIKYSIFLSSHRFIVFIL